MRAPARPSASRVGHEAEPPGVAGPVNFVLYRDNPQQLGGRHANPAAHTGAYRGRATYHCGSLPPCPGSSPGAPPGDHAWEVASVSGRMSIRQPVRRAANRAFCPSRPMASDSW